MQHYPVGGGDRKWFVTWIIRYGQFGGYDGSSKFEVDRQSTIAFCRQLLAHGTPAWQRLQAVRCLIAYRAIVLGEKDGLLEEVRSKLADQAAQESNRTAEDGVSEPPIEHGPPVAGEAAFLTTFRRTMRRRRMKFDTEKAYTGWLIRFARRAKVSDPTGLGEAEIREFLTEVALGNSPGSLSSSRKGGRSVQSKY